MNYIKGKEAAIKLGLCQATLRSYADKGLIDTIKGPGGKRRYNVDKYLRDNGADKAKRKVCYCRVSTHGQKDDLDRQTAYMVGKYPAFEVISDVGSGINFNRPGLKQIIDYAVKGQLETLVIAYKDRLCRIGYDLIEHIIKTYSNAEIIIDAGHPETINEEIANDLIQIITVYTAKINGMRKYKKPVM